MAEELPIRGADSGKIDGNGKISRYFQGYQPSRVNYWNFSS